MSSRRHVKVRASVCAEAGGGLKVIGLERDAIDTPKATQWQAKSTGDALMPRRWLTNFQRRHRNSGVRFLLDAREKPRQFILPDQPDPVFGQQICQPAANGR